MKKQRIVEKGYDKISKKYYAQRHIFVNRREIEEFVSSLPENARVLDAGCGAGVPVTKLLAEAGFDVIGVDFSENMLKLARKNVPKATFVKKDMTKLDFEANSFDGLLAIYSIIHIPREKHHLLFQSFHKILKPRGIMLISMGSSEWEGIEKYYGVEMFWSHYNPEKSVRIIKKAGFKIMYERCVETGGEKHYWILAKNRI